MNERIAFCARLFQEDEVELYRGECVALLTDSVRSQPQGHVHIHE